jgi:geranylgeranyl pyrophosphate synthase
MDAIEAKDGASLRRVLARSGSIDAAREKAISIVEEAKALLPATKRAHSRELLLELADRVVARNH